MRVRPGKLYSNSLTSERSLRRYALVVAPIVWLAACGADAGSGGGSTAAGEEPHNDPGRDAGPLGDDSGSADAASDSGGEWNSSDAGADWGGGGGSDAAEDWGSGGGGDAGADWGGGGGSDAGALDDAGAAPDGGVEVEEAIANTNISFGGEADFGFFRNAIASGRIPTADEFEAPGFFAEHHTPLPVPDCGERVCVQAMTAVMTSLSEDLPCTMLQIGLNSPIAADEANRPPLNLVVVVDVSGSMADDRKLVFVQQGLNALIDSLDDEDQLALVPYSSSVGTVTGMAPLDGNRARFRTAANSLIPAGGTNILAGLERGYAISAASFDSGRQNRLILISDGVPSSGTPSEHYGLVARNTELDIGLTTIGVGTDYNRDLMLTMARTGGGNAYFVENAAAVDEVFADEISFFTVPVAFDLELIVNEGTYYDLGRAYGAPAWEAEVSGGRLRMPSVFLAHRASHSDVTEGGGRRGGGSALLLELMPRTATPDASLAGSEVASVTLRFREPGTDRIVEQSIEVAYPYAPGFVLDGGYFEARDVAAVQKSFVMLNVFVALQNASEAFHDANYGLASSGLQAILAALLDYNEELADVDIDFDIELVQDVLALVQRLTPVPVPPFEPRDDAWPCD